MANKVDRRDFVKTTVAGAAILASASAYSALVAATPMDPNKQIVSALGSVFVPSKAGDPGYTELEALGISDYVMKEVPAADSLGVFKYHRQAILRW